MIGRAGICACLLFLSAAMCRAEAAGWRLEYVFGEQRAITCSIAVGADGVAHLAYIDLPHKQIHYARRDPATGWVQEFSGHQYAESPDVAIQLDAMGRPRIAYTDPVVSGSDIPRLKLAANLEGEWTVDPVSSRLVYGVSMGLLKDSEPFIAYGDYFDRQAMHVAKKRDGMWVTHKVTNNAVGATALAVDNDAGAVHVVYFDIDERALKYARLADGRWEFETIERLGPDDEGRNPFSMTLDAHGQPAAAYAFDGRIRIARRLQGAWQIQLLPEDAEARLWQPVVRIDARNNLHVAYGKYLASQLQLRYGRTRMGVWQLETVDDNAPWAHSFSFALDRHGAAHIVYLSDQALFLRYATNRRPVVD